MSYQVIYSTIPQPTVPLDPIGRFSGGKVSKSGPFIAARDAIE